ncbi:MAG: ABC transporter substrate-binding protein [Spirochaetota bacterium]|nr:MAG: ABC transporter substrate-binding protein [Spirochaetota bacterium]
MKEKQITKVLLTTSIMIFIVFLSVGQMSGEDLSTLKISLLPYISSAPFFIALEEGYFAEQGIKLEFMEFKQPGLTTPALARGDLDVSTDSIGSSLFSAIARGLEIKIVADKGHFSDRCMSSAIMVRKALYDSGEITKIEHLQGRKVSLSLIPVWGYVYEQILSKGNLTLDDIEIVKMPTAARITALETGSIDAAGATDPDVKKMESLGIAVAIANYQDSVPNYQSSTVIYGPNLLEKNPELGKKFMIAYLKGVRQYNKGKTQRNLEIIHKHTGLDLDILKEICFISFHPDGHVNTQYIPAVQDWAYEKGYIDSKITLEELIDMSFAEYANEVLERKDM